MLLICKNKSKDCHVFTLYVALLYLNQNKLNENQNNNQRSNANNLTGWVCGHCWRAVIEKTQYIFIYNNYYYAK